MLGGWQSSRAAAAAVEQLPQPRLARPGHQLPPATEERAQQFGACPNLGIISQTQKWDFAGRSRTAGGEEDKGEGSNQDKAFD